MNSIFFGLNRLFGEGYGLLYNWYAIDGNTSNLMSNLHVPTDIEWTTLTNYLGGLSVAGGKLKEVGLAHWDDPNIGATDEFNFKAIGSGSRGFTGVYDNLKLACLFWTSTEYPIDTSKARFRTIRNLQINAESTYLQKERGFSIRCVRDLTEQEKIDFPDDGQLVEITSDYDGNEYNIIRIGTQGWASTNLKTTHYLDGSALVNVIDSLDWKNLIPTYGLLYNWYTIDGNSTNLITDLHVPSDAEWTTMTTYLGGLSVAGGKLKEIGFVHWKSTGTSGTDEVNFTALPGGLRLYNDGTFSSIKFQGNWWSSTETGTNNANNRNIVYNTNIVAQSGGNKPYGFSIRCMRDLTEQEKIDFPNDGDLVESKLDYEGNSYDVVRIGDQGWTTTNLKTAHYLNGTAISRVEDNTTWAGLSTAACCAYENNKKFYCAYDNDEKNV